MLPPSASDLGGEGQPTGCEHIGVEVQLGAMVIDVDATGIEVEDADGTAPRIESRTKVWAAGVAGLDRSASTLAEQSGAAGRPAGRMKVNADLTLPGHPEVFVVGDMISLDGLPGVAQVAIQGRGTPPRQIKRAPGRPAARARSSTSTRAPWRRSRGSRAVASVGKLRFTGFIAWLMWLAVHLVYIIGFKHRVTTLLHWAVSFLGRGRSERVVTEQQVLARRALDP